jgi:hypothetical protein
LIINYFRDHPSVNPVEKHVVILTGSGQKMSLYSESLSSIAPTGEIFLGKSDFVDKEEQLTGLSHLATFLAGKDLSRDLFASSLFARVEAFLIEEEERLKLVRKEEELLLAASTALRLEEVELTLGEELPTRITSSPFAAGYGRSITRSPAPAAWIPGSL